MRLLLFSDLHCDLDAAKRIADRSGQFDLLLGAGDFASARRHLQGTIDQLRQIQTPTVLVPGNSESFDELCEACAGWTNAHVLHGSQVSVQGVVVFGLGGAVPVTPFGSWSYDFTEEEADELLAPCPLEAILVTHSPPQGAVDRSSYGMRLGSEAVRQTIDRCAPRLVVCGHIHESAGRHDFIGRTPVVNAGPEGVEWTLDLPAQLA